MKKINFKKIGVLIRNNYSVNRSLPLILFISIFAICCIIGALPISDVESRYFDRFVFDAYESYRYTMEYTYQTLTGTSGAFSIFFAIAALVLPFLSVLSINGFMRDKSGNDFYHSLSVTRGEIFLANYLTVFVNSAATVILSQLGGIFLMNMIADYKPMSLGELLVAQLPVLGTTLLFIALFTAISMIATIGAGTVFASIFNYAFINFYAPATILAVAVAGRQLFDTYLSEYVEHYPQMFANTSPFIRYVLGISQIIKLTALSYILIALATLALIALGIWIYTVKKNENAFKPLPFTPITRPLQYLVTFDVILLVGTFFHAISMSFVWCIVGILLALFFSFIAFNSFVNKSFNGVLHKPQHMAVILVLTLIFGAVFVADIFHVYREPQPDLEKINSAYVNFSVYTPESEKYHHFEFVQEVEYDQTTLLTDEATDDLAILWELTQDCSENCYTERYDSEESIRISLNIQCDNDYSGYYNHVYVDKTCEHYDRVKEIIGEFIDKYNESTDEYYYETTGPTVVVEEYYPEI